MEKTPFSVSMCVYGGDRPDWFRTAVDSLLAQTLLPSEIVIVVDGPVPDTLNEILAEYEQNPLFHILRLPENRGHGEARRAGLAACSHEIVAIMDADDISLPERFARQIPLLAADPTLAVVGANITEFIGEPENIVACRAVQESDAAIKHDMKTRCPINMVTVAFRRSEVERVGGIVDWYGEEDYYLWIRMAQAGCRFANLPESLVNVRIGEEMYGRRGGKRYYESERKLQKYMLQHKMIGYGTYLLNVSKRFVVQRLLPNRLRGWVFRVFARKKV